MDKFLELYAKYRYLIWPIIIGLGIVVLFSWLNEYTYCKNMAILMGADYKFTLQGCLVRPLGVEQWAPLELFRYQIPLQ